MPQLTIQQVLDSALQFHKAGRLQEAENLYRQILAVHPSHADAMHFLGVIAHQVGRHDVAVELIRQSLALGVNNPQAYSNFGNALRMRGQLDEAIAAYRRAIALGSNLPEVYSNLGNALQNSGQLDDAIAALQRAIALRPSFAEAHYNLGISLKSARQFEESVESLRKAIALKPDYAEAHNHLGNALINLGRTDQAINAYRQAIALRPDFPEAHSNLGNALFEEGQFEEAIAACRYAIALKPDFADAYRNLASALQKIGEIDQVIAAVRQVMALEPDSPHAHSNLLSMLNYHPGYDARTIADEHRRWGVKFGEPLEKFIQPHTNDHDPNRKLRIGYVSPDFRSHVISQFLLGLFEQRDRSGFEVFCYSNVIKPDQMTNRFASLADHWQPILCMTDQQVADRIRADRIDILVDLAGHTAGNRLMVFARKPAPVQVSYLGYPHRTGLTAIDYRLTDALADPVDSKSSEQSEALYRLPQTNWCFSMIGDSPAVAPLPALARGRVTFGSFNNFSKVTDAMIEAWGRILHQVPASRLMLKSPALTVDSVRQRIFRILTTRGVDADRLDVHPFQPDHASHLALYNQMDVALDTFPYHGTTTTCDALWMGVPVITLAGATHVSRVGASLLTNLGLLELVADAVDDYVRLAVTLAGDLPRLADLRSTLRQRMQHSPLMDAPKFARDIEAAYRQMWKSWCKGALDPSPGTPEEGQGDSTNKN